MRCIGFSDVLSLVVQRRAMEPGLLQVAGRCCGVARWPAVAGAWVRTNLGPTSRTGSARLGHWSPRRCERL